LNIFDRRAYIKFYDAHTNYYLAKIYALCRAKQITKFLTQSQINNSALVISSVLDFVAGRVDSFMGAKSETRRTYK
jgi:hypothetical protein